MLGQRRRRWSDIETALVEYHVFAARGARKPSHNTDKLKRNIGPVLAQCQDYWPKIEPSLDQYLITIGYITMDESYSFKINWHPRDPLPNNNNYGHNFLFLLHFNQMNIYNYICIFFLIGHIQVWYNNTFNCNILLWHSNGILVRRIKMHKVNQLIF